jgi:dienelactone hydrolase
VSPHPVSRSASLRRYDCAWLWQQPLQLPGYVQGVGRPDCVAATSGSACDACQATYQGLPQDNASGYDDNSPVSHVNKLKGNLLLVHGTGDDNVHYQNSMDMITALVAANKQFDLFIYPNKNHGIYGGNTRLHLFTKMTNFLNENL